MSKRWTMIAILTLALGAYAPPALRAQSGDASGESEALQSTRDTLARWVETQQLISKEKRDWQLGKEMLDQRISLVQDEIASLEKRTKEVDANISDADVKRRELIAQNEALEAASHELENAVAGLESKTRDLLAVLPEPILSRVALLSQRIPKDPAKTELSLGQRYQNVIGVLNEVNKFNRDITVTTELRTMPGGATAEVETLYFGLGQAYYVTANRDAAGIGRPSPDGWVWTEANGLADRVAETIAILKNEHVPAFVPLPVEIR